MVRQSPAAVAGKEQLCRCSAAWLEAPTPLFPGATSSPPTHYLVCELCARILAHQRTMFSGVHKERKANCGGYKSHLVLHVLFILNPEGERQCFSANLFSVCVNMYIFFNFQFVASAYSCFLKTYCRKITHFQRNGSVVCLQIIRVLFKMLHLFCLGNHIHMCIIFV